MQDQLAGDAQEHGEMVAKGADQVHGDQGQWRAGQGHGGHPSDEHERGDEDQGRTAPPTSATVATSSRGKMFPERTRPKFRKGVQPVGKNLTIRKESRGLRDL